MQGNVQGETVNNCMNVVIWSVVTESQYFTVSVETERSKNKKQVEDIHHKGVKGKGKECTVSLFSVIYGSLYHRSR